MKPKEIKPFFWYYGGKWRMTPKYPKPKHEKIIEPFAGAAGYATRYYDHQVQIHDVDPHIFYVWDYLIQATPEDILALPLMHEFETTDDLVGHIPRGAVYLIGFWLNNGVAAPCKRPSKWAREYKYNGWRESKRDRIASQVEHIKHWVVTSAPYPYLLHQKATWFVDPPYQGKAGRHYKHNQIDYLDLSRWVRALSGQVIVCENAGADWLPFEHLADVNTAVGARQGQKMRKSKEFMWYRES